MSDIKDRAFDWLSGGDTGMSSRAVLMHMLARVCDGSYPSDPADLGRCLRMLAKFPEWDGRIREMAQYGGAWIGLAEQWDSLAALMAEEVGIDWSKGNSAQKTFHAMKLAEADGLRRDPKYECRFFKDGTVSSWTKQARGESPASKGEGE